ncbi:DUF2460 domain-containing protein [Asticcacaulis sp. AND118]|uniref:DUF2460 domain-containing protein n=1 Tax=Asticcacaulis sp. AND118 TaxID=2840468 RepID=UPI001CFF9DFF|nr:DUF2460 domain-containing protein [Asticcacaulis sp. AND118]UDF03225.1 DUF2460 domain-containing protein [Asticcacaulis sp. AND118]
MFHEVTFPARLAFGSGAGIERRVRVTTLASGYEQRISAWALGRRRYLIGAGIRRMADAAALLSFFEAREGPLYGFRFRDFTDGTSGEGESVDPLDQVIATADGATRAFQLLKTYGTVVRPIRKPVEGSVSVALNGVEQSAGFSVDHTTGMVTFDAAPAEGAIVSAGFRFDVPVRFDADRIDLTLEGFDAGRVVAIPLIEIRV